MNIQLYYAPVACSLVPYVTLTEANATFTVTPINIRAKKQMSEEYLLLNPKHKVPLLIVDDKPLTENIAIQVWIAQTFPKANLLPDDPWRRLQALSVMSWCASGIHPLLSRINNPSTVTMMPEAEDDVRSRTEVTLREALGIADDMLKGKDYFMGVFSTVDAYFFWCFRRAGMLGLDLGEFHNCHAHFERMMSRESVQKVLKFEKQVIDKFSAQRFG